MKALTIWQPWASLVAVGEKRIETRSWSTSYRGRVLIHAARQVPRLDEAEAGWLAIGTAMGSLTPLDAYTATRSVENPSRFPPGDQGCAPLPLGAVVASAVLVDVVHMVAECSYPGGPTQHLVVTDDDLHLHAGHTQQSVEAERPFGDYRPGRFAWLLDDVEPTSKRCPRCWGSGGPVPMFDDCPTCWSDADRCGVGVCPPVPMRGRQGLWNVRVDDWGA